MQKSIFNKRIFFWIGDRPGRNKFIIGSGEGYHITFLLDERKRVLNIHKTNDNSLTPTKYEPLFEIGFYSLLKLIVGIRRQNWGVLEKYWLGKRVNLGKLGRHHCVLIPMVEDEASLSKIVTSKRSKKIELKKDFPERTIDLMNETLTYPDEM